jgi:CheY-like chemotaxis protein
MVTRRLTYIKRDARSNFNVQMPNKNGYEATMEIRQINGSAAIPIMSYSGIMVEDRDRCLKAGMNDYLSKPIIESDLEILLKWLNK